MKTDVSKLLYGFDEHSEGIRTDTTDSGKTINHYRAMKMTLPGVSVTNTDVMLLPGLAKSCQLSPRAGIFGRNNDVGISSREENSSACFSFSLSAWV